MSKKSCLWCLVLLLCILSCCACGKEEGWEIGVEGYVYTIQDPESGTGEYPGLCSALGEKSEDFLVSGDSLYFTRMQNGSGDVLFRADLTGGEEGRITAEKVDTAGPVTSFAVDPEGSIYYLVQEPIGETYWSAGNSVLMDNTLYKQGADGDPEVLFTEQSKQGVLAVDSLAVDGEGTVCLLLGSRILLFGNDDSSPGSISLGEESGIPQWSRGSLMCDEKGRILCVLWDYDSGKRTVHELRPGQKTSLVPVDALTGSVAYSLTMTSRGLMIQKDDGVLYSFSQDAGKSVQEPVLRWQDSDLVSGKVEELEILPDGEFLISYAGEILLLMKTSVEDLPQKELVVVASVSPSRDLEESVISFNKQDSRYRVMLEDFGTGEGAGLLDARIVSSSPPDLLDIVGLDIWKYAQKGVLADLSVLVGEDVVSRYPDNLRESFTIGGRLVCIPKQFKLHTVVCRREDAGTLLNGYDSAELVDTVDGLASKGRSTISGGSGGEYLLETFFAREYLTKYIDWEKGSCSFDGEDFGSFLEWVKDCPKKDEIYVDYVPEEVLLVDYTLSDFVDILRMKEMLGDEPALVGFPRADRVLRHVAEAVDGICIVEDSPHKEGAAAFLEYYLAQDTSIGTDDLTGLPYFYDFPTRREDLEKMFEQAVTPGYVTDEEGNRLKYSDGSYAMLEKGNYGVEGNIISYYFVEEELAKLVMDAIEQADFTPYTGAEVQIMEILQEEAELYFNGQKSLDEVQDIIQNRVSLLVSEGA